MWMVNDGSNPQPNGKRNEYLKMPILFCRLTGTFYVTQQDVDQQSLAGSFDPKPSSLQRNNSGMSTIRRQSILSSGIIYLGFALGFLNTYLFTRQGGFTQSEYGLYGTFMGVANIINAFANFGMQAYISKFYPYYQDNLKVRDNDMMAWAFVTSILGFIMVLAAAYYFQRTCG